MDNQQKSTVKSNGENALQKAFLAAYRLTGNVTRSAIAANIDRTTHYLWLREDPDYAIAFTDAEQEAADYLESEARRRAVDGVQRMKFFKGQPIMAPVLDDSGRPKTDENGEVIVLPYVEHEYSDFLLGMLMKGAMPEKYRERYEATVEANVDTRIQVEEDDGWYRNKAHELQDKATGSAESPTADPAAPSEVQGGGVRPEMGEDGDGDADDSQGARA